MQERASITIGRYALALGEGRQQEALEGGLEAASVRGSVGPDHPMFKQGLVLCVNAAAALGDFSRLEETFEGVRRLPPGRRSPTATSQLARYDAHVAAHAGDREPADRGFRHAAELLREVGAQFLLAIVLLEHGELLAAESPGDAEPLLTEAGEIFERLEAAPWLERAERLQSEHMFA